jgi:CHAT domain-containing protein/uncharacterized protein HemY
MNRAAPGLLVAALLAMGGSARGAEPPSVADALAAARTDAERTAILDASPDALTADLAAQLLARGKPLAGSDAAAALALLRASQAVAERRSDKPGVARALFAIGQIHNARDEFDAAEAAYQQSRALREELGDQGGLAEALGQLGVLRSKRGDYDAALVFYRQALPLAEAAGSKVETATILNNIGNAHNGKGEHTEALAFFERSVTAAEEAGSQPRLAIAFNNIGLVHQKQGDYRRAMPFFERSLAIKEALGNKVGAAITYQNIGELYRVQGDEAQALSFFLKGLDIFVAAEMKTGIAMSLNNAGEVYRARGDHARALQYYERALSQFKAIGDKVGTAEVLDNVGQVHEARGEQQEALARYQESLGYSEETTDRVRIAQTLLNIADLRVARGEAAQALPLVERAIVVSGESGTRETLWRARATEGRAQLALGHVDAAREAWEAAVTTIEGLRGQVTGGDSERERAFEDKVAPYAALALMHARAGDAPRALGWAERARARVLLDAFRGSSAGDARGPAIAPETGAVVEELAGIVPDARTALLEFVVGDEETVLFVASRDAGRVRLDTYRIAVTRAALAARVARFRQAIASRDLGFAAEAEALHALVLEPAAERLRGRSRLIVVPDGPLWELPFAALAPRPGHFLVESASVAYAPSISVLAETARRPPGASSRKALLALGNSPRTGAEPLPEAERQVTALARIYGADRSTTYLGAEATEEHAKAAAGQYRVVHVASHGVLSAASPMHSHLVLSPSATGGSEDGYLEAREILGLHLDADLAVLSACETGLGRIGAGEGVIGLSWAFFVAGCPRTVVSLWKVEAASTTALMVAFHRRLLPRLAAGRALGAAEALRQAALSVRRDPARQHPFYWAGFVLVGDGG